MVFAKAPLWIPDGADDAGLQISQAADMIHYSRKITKELRGQQQCIDGEIPPQHVLARIGFKANSLRMPSVAVIQVATKRGHFHTVYQNDTELRAHQIGPREKL